MPRIPIYTASGNLQGGPSSPDASPLAFNKAAGLGALAQGIESVGRVASIYSDKKQTDIANTWAAGSIYEFENWSEKLLSDAEQQNNVNIAEDYKSAAEKRIQEFAKQAPNPAAEKAFSNAAKSSIARKYASALNQGSSAMIRVAGQASKESVAAMMNNYRTALARDPIDASVTLQDNFQMHMDLVNATYGDVAPKVASMMRAEAVENVAFGVAATNPKFARRITEQSKDLDERVKQAIYARIDATSKTENNIAQIAFSRQMDHDLKVGYKEMSPIQMPPPESFDVFGDKKEVKMVEYGLKYNALNTAAKFYPEIQATDADYQISKISELESLSVYGDDAAQLLKDRATLAKRHQETDLIGWMSANNPEINEYRQMADTAPTPEEATLYRDVSMDAMLKYQGPPPPDATPEEAAKYFNIPEGLRSVLSVETAEKIATELKNAPPTKKSDMIDQFFMEYGRHSDYAWNDLYRLPNGRGIGLEYKMAAMIDSRAVRSAVLGSMEVRGEKSVFTPEESKVITDRVASDQSLAGFIADGLGDDFQGKPETSAVYGMVENYAKALKEKNPKLSAKAAADTAIREIIGANMGIISVNAQKMAISKFDKVNGVERSDDDFKRIESFLNRTVAMFPVEQVDWDKIAIQFDATSSNKKVLQNLVRSTGFLMSNPDGNSATLYIKPDNGPPVALSRKDNSLFTFKFDEIIRDENERIRKAFGTDQQKMIQDYLGEGAPDL